VPKAVVNEQRWVPATMEGVVERLGSALLKVVSNKGAAGPDGMTIEALQAQWPNVSCRLRATLLDGTWRPGEARRALIPRRAAGSAGWGSPTRQTGW
jgi:retron-type reverse transcriptase